MALTTIKAAGLTADLIDETKLADNSIDSEHYNDGSIDTAHIAADQITGALIADDAVGAEHIEVLDAALQFGDSVKAQFGASNDLEIYHNGSASFISDSGPGDLLLLSSQVQIVNPANSEAIAIFTENGSCQLYYDNSLKLATSSGGVNITGELTVTTDLVGIDNSKLKLGNSSDLQIYHSGTKSYIKDAGTGSLRICSDDFRIYNAADDEYMLKAVENGGVELYYDNNKKLETVSGGVDITGYVNIQSGGDIYLEDNGIVKLGTSNDMQIYHDGTNSRITNTSSNDFLLDTGGDFYIRNTNTEKYIKCEANGKVYLYYNNSAKLFTQSWGAQVAGNFVPDGDNSRNLGASNERWANVYSADMHLNNTGAGGNEVDGSEGSWTIQEGANDLFLLNRTNNKKYKFNLTEIT